MLKYTSGRWAALALAVAVACAAFAATGASAGTTKFKPNPMTGQIRLVTHTAVKTTFDALIHNFNVYYPNIKVTAQYIPPGPGFSQALFAQINAGNAPDVMFTNPNQSGDPSAVALAKAGKLLDLSKRPFVKRIPKSDRSVFFVGGKVYAEPIYKIAAGINVDMTEMKKRGWALPKTFAQLLNLCHQATSQGINLIAFPGQVPGAAVVSMSAPFVWGKDPNWAKEKAAGKVTFADSPLWHTMFQRMIQMRDANCFQPGWQAAAVPDMFAAMAQHHAVMQLAPSGALSTLHAALPNDTFVSVPVPGDRAADTQAELGYNFAISVSATTPNKAAALAFIDFAGREGQSRLLANINASVSLHDVNVGKFPPAMAAYAPLVKAGKVPPWPENEFPTPVTTTNFQTVTSSILVNNKDIREALKLLDDTWGK